MHSSGTWRVERASASSRTPSIHEIPTKARIESMAASFMAIASAALIGRPPEHR